MPFTFEPQLEKLDEVPEKYRPLYVPTEDKKGFELDSDLAKRLDTTSINKALDTERKTVKEMKKAVEAYAKLGKPEELTEKLAELEKAVASGTKDDIKEAQAKFERAKSDMLATHKKELEAKDALLSKKEQTVAKYLIDSQAAAAIGEAKGSTKLLLPIIRNSVRVVEDGEGYSVRVVDESGNERNDGKGGYLTIQGLVAEMRKSPDYAGAFAASGNSGGGTPSGGKGGTPGTGSKNSVQKIATGLEKLRPG